MNETTDLSQSPALLVHLHLYYHEQWGYFAKKLKYLNLCKWDLVVTLTRQDPALCAAIRAFKPGAKIIPVSNRGYDVWPFLQVIYQTDLTAYDYVLKLHTKRTQKIKLKDARINWRNRLVEPLIGSPERVKTVLNMLQNDKQIGLLANKHLCLDFSDFAINPRLYEQVCSRLHLTPCAGGRFIAGTMFFIRAKCLRVFQQYPFTENDFDVKSQSGQTDTLAHALERIFIHAVEQEGLKVKLVQDNVFVFNRFVYKVFHKPFHRSKVVSGAAN